jgi:YfiH family protein
MTLQIITAPDLEGTVHGFFTRRGGASSGIFAGLNCGAGSSDLAEAVAINRARAAAALGLAPEALVTVHQVHSARAVTVTGPMPLRPEADALVSAVPGIALAVMTADCAPVLLADPVAGVVGAAHAGWRGALDGIIEATVAGMVAIGARPERIAAAVGPTISQAAYEVGPEFLDRFRDADPDALRHLPGYVLARLRAAGVGAARWTGHCTYRDPGLFFSYRRSVHAGEADYGRLVSAIRL